MSWGGSRTGGAFAGGPAVRIRAALLERSHAATSHSSSAAPVIVKHLEAMRDMPRVRAVVEYISRLESGSADRIVDESGLEISPRDAVALVEAWERDPLHARARSSPVAARHFVFSLPVGDCKSATVDSDRALRAAKVAADRALGALEAAAAATFGVWGQHYVAARHMDTDHPHLHVVVHWRRPLGPVLPLDQTGVGLDALRQAVAEEGRAAGFEVDARRSADVASVTELWRSERRRARQSAVAPEEPEAADMALLLARWVRTRRDLAAALELHAPGPWARAMVARFRREVDEGRLGEPFPGRAAAGPADPYSMPDRSAPPLSSSTAAAGRTDRGGDTRHVRGHQR